ncbi:MAG TPA: ElyC/SanA/YdcF family protein [Phycicoccus sp.]|nr:ElyC/SanA/YdcF family protein [Phycicoccus sp.]HQH06209.1 ElyC/SanA/YdcF family protein [Phycicoccus sp.]HQK30266.1 ElyC/SanA/YdcF family protein [Phycicoccus sp.]HQY95645.1 ElyC/SanA/YdcF family protein [Phycicoccus sp.]HRA43720.1 ElyC/SanA/YdcF family protein [Phycicoccus sp.]
MSTQISRGMRAAGMAGLGGAVVIAGQYAVLLALAARSPIVSVMARKVPAKVRPTGRRRWVRRIAVAAVAGSVVALAPWGWVHWRSHGLVHDADDTPSTPVALVLGAGLTPAGRPTPYLAARLDVAAALHDAGTVSVILVSGDNRTHAYDEPTAMYDYLVAKGVPADDVVRDYAGRDTYDSCARAKRIFGVDRLVLVSQGYHLPRAVATCRALGVETTGAGEWTMQERYPGLWQSYSLREVAASWKTVIDLVSGRDPVLGQQETSVTDALRRKGIRP